MNKYNCNLCDFHTRDKFLFSRHLKTKKHSSKIESSKSHPKVIQKSSKSHPKVIQKSSKSNFDETVVITNNENILICKYCKKSFAYKQGLHKHIKYVCKENKDESFKEMARLMNEIEIMKKEMLKKNKDQNKKYDALEKHLEKINIKLQITNNVNSNSNNVNNTNNTIIIMNSFDKPNISQLTDNDVCPNIKSLNMGISNLVNNVYFNPKLPENHSIRVSNLKKEFATVFNGEHWDTVTVEYLLNRLHLWGEYFFEKWMLTNGSDKMVNMFDKYMTNLEDNPEMQKTAKNNLLLICYNGLKKLKLQKCLYMNHPTNLLISNK
jgi:gas vesicle protein